jgi:DNA-binding NarL/FixJ family response regulator
MVEAKIRILVADDHPMLREGLVAVLGTQPDFEVVGEAADGSETVRLAETLQPDVILLDLEMPGVDGVAALEGLRDAGSASRAIVFTAYDTDQRILGALRAGARGYLLKGARRQEIQRAIEAVGSGEVIFGPGIAERVMTYFRHVRARPTAQAFPELTDRERVILGKIAEGLDNAEIARDLGLSIKTVRNHASNVFAKLHVAHRAQAIVLAREAGIESGDML